jgi:hypothetical protein
VDLREAGGASHAGEESGHYRGEQAGRDVRRGMDGRTQDRVKSVVSNLAELEKCELWRPATRAVNKADYVQPWWRVVYSRLEELGEEDVADGRAGDCSLREVRRCGGAEVLFGVEGGRVFNVACSMCQASGEWLKA